MTSDPQPDKPTQQVGQPYGSAGPVREGETLDDRYRLDKLVGRGATASVFRSTDRLLVRAVAVKVFHDHLNDATNLARQRSEMELLANLTHPNLVVVYDARIAGTTTRPDNTLGSSGHSYLVMELIEGHTLAAALAPRRPLPADEVVEVGLEIASALAFVHSRDLVHRDIKPANILIAGPGQIKLSDFGIARLLGSDRVTQVNDVVGTPAYLSPEQAVGDPIEPPTDIYAFGLVLLECLTGRKAFEGTALETAIARLNRDPDVPDDLPAGWSVLLRDMTARDPAARPSAQGVVDRLRSLPAGNAESVLPLPEPAASATTVLTPVGYPDDLASADESPEPPSRTEPRVTTSAAAPERRGRRRSLAMVAPGAALAIGVGAGIIAANQDSPTDTPTDGTVSSVPTTSAATVSSTGTASASPAGESVSSPPAAPTTSAAGPASSSTAATSTPAPSATTASTTTPSVTVSPPPSASATASAPVTSSAAPPTTSEPAPPDG